MFHFVVMWDKTEAFMHAYNSLSELYKNKIFISLEYFFLGIISIDFF